MCTDAGGEYKFQEIWIEYEWHDNIDANSFIETYNKFYRGAGIGAHLQDFPHLLENTVDLVLEKTLAPDFSVIINGFYHPENIITLPWGS